MTSGVAACMDAAVHLIYLRKEHLRKLLQTHPSLLPQTACLTCLLHANLVSMKSHTHHHHIGITGAGRPQRLFLRGVHGFYN